MIFRPLPVLTAAAALAVAVLLLLGFWQLDRREQKHDLLARIEAARTQDAASLETLLGEPAANAAFRRVSAGGRFRHDQEVFVYAPRSPEGPGYKVVVPFDMASGDTILVDRGWVPAAEKSPRLRASGQAAGTVQVEGLLRPSTPPGWFTPPPDAANRVFYSRNSLAIAGLLELPLATALILEAERGVAGGPTPLPAEVALPDNHLQYAFTWFGLALVLAAIYLRYHHQQGRLRFGP